MRKLLVLLFSVLCVEIYAQDSYSAWFQQGKQSVLTFEYIGNGDNFMNYLYTDIEFGSKNTTNSVYILASRDQKFWDRNIFIHGELRVLTCPEMCFDNVYLLGPMFGLIGKDNGFLNLQTMFRYDGKADYQVSLLGEYSYKRFYYSGFYDTYGTDKIYCHSENRFFFTVYKKLRIGANFIFTINEEEKSPHLKPMGVVRIDL